MEHSSTPRRERGGFLALPATVWLILFFTLPLLIVLVMSFLSRGRTPSDYHLPVTLENYQETFNDIYRPVLERSVVIAFQSTLICFLLGYPLAFFISTRRRAWVRNLSLFMVILPFWTNFLVRTYAWRVIIGRRGVLNEILQNQLPKLLFSLETNLLDKPFGINLLSNQPVFLDRPLELLNTETAVLIGLVYGYLPFMVLPIYASIERFDFRLVEAGHDLGANDWRVFWRIVFPLTLPGVIAGWILVLIPTIGAFVTPDLLGGTDGLMIGNLIQRQFRGTGGNWPLGSAMSIIMMVMVMIAVVVYFYFADESSYTQRGILSRIWERLRGRNPIIQPDQNSGKSAISTSRFEMDWGSLILIVVAGLSWSVWEALLLQVFSLATFWAAAGSLLTRWVYTRKNRNPSYGSLMGIILGTTGGLLGVIIAVIGRDSLPDQTLIPWLTSGITFLAIMLPFWIFVPKLETTAGVKTLDRIQVFFDLLMRRIGKIVLSLWPIANYIFLWSPIVLLVVFSFNDSRRSASTWQGFTTRWYDNIFRGVVGSEAQFSTEEMLNALQTSLKISLTATIIATIIGTMIAMALVRSRFPGKRLVDGLLYLPIIIPDITQGVSLLVFFGFIFNLWESLTGTRHFASPITVIIAHVAFNISFVAIVVRARLVDMNPKLEEAARDLGANEWRTFWRVTYPLLLPGIISGALLAFTLSLDDFVVTFFAGGSSTVTLTIFVYGLVRRSVTPEINAISTLMIMASTILIGLSLMLQGRRTM